MATLLTALLGVAKVAVISGGDWPQFENLEDEKYKYKEYKELATSPPDCYGTGYDKDAKLGDNASTKPTKPSEIINKLQNIPDSLITVIRAWDSLPENIREGILAMIAAFTKNG